MQTSGQSLLSWKHGKMASSSYDWTSTAPCSLSCSLLLACLKPKVYCIKPKLNSKNKTKATIAPSEITKLTRYSTKQLVNEL